MLALVLIPVSQLNYSVCFLSGEICWENCVSAKAAPSRADFCWLLTDSAYNGENVGTKSLVEICAFVIVFLTCNKATTICAHCWIVDVLLYRYFTGILRHIIN